MKYFKIHFSITPKWFLQTKVFGLLILFAFAASAQTQSDFYYSKILKGLNQFSADTLLNTASWGYSVISAKTGKTLLSRNEKNCLTPASTLKTLTTIAALSILGKDYTFKTRLQYAGRISKDSVLHGDVYIIGGGDPSFGSSRIPTSLNENQVLDSFQMALKKAGIKSIKGRIISDATHFEEEAIPPTWAWEDLGNYYGAGVSGLNFHENLYTAYFRPGDKLGEPTSIIKTEPEVIGLEIDNRVTTAAKGTGDNSGICGAPYCFERYAVGTVPMGDTAFKVFGSLPDPALLVAQLLSQRIPCTLPATTSYLVDIWPLSPKEIYVIESPKLSEIVLYTNVYSLNLNAETLLKEMGFKKLGEGTRANGLKAVNAFWRKKGLDMTGINILDGSGLSRGDAVSAKQFAQAMYITSKDSVFDAFYRSLPIGGYVGNFMHLKPAYANGKFIRAKTGYMNRVWSYTGYATNKKGELICFAFVINNYPGSFSYLRKRTDRLFESLLE
ncbi:MAG: D-alanyl-D-alanine carboxypeptidase/D-alanyl-D-alanine-endopeptidase [Bacteroidetes bacterium]|nr:D-alanyl-D-alanine carboxypeptidase/D-alanyl-D-alanine-endopeptidase [Bacteroidota bacterium]